MHYTPPELVDEILQKLSIHTRTVRACSLVCRSWNSSARPYLFNKFVLDERVDQLDGNADTSERRCQRLLKLFDGSPHLIGYFRSIELKFDCHNMDRYERSRLVHLELLHTLLRRFTHVNALRLSGFGNAWTDLPENLLSSLQHVAANVTFEQLWLSRWTFSFHASELLEFLRGCSPALRILELFHVRFHKSMSSIDIPTVKLASLEKLHITAWDSGPNGCFHEGTLLIPNLRTFWRHVEVLPSAKQLHPSILYPCVPNTVSDVTLEVRCDRYTPSSFDTPRFGGYNGLCHLRLKISSYSNAQHPIALQFIGKFFSDIPANALLHLQTVVIELGTYPRLKESDWNDFPWKMMAAAFNPLLVIGILAKVELLFHLDQYLGPTIRPLCNESIAHLGDHLGIIGVVEQIRLQCQDLERKAVLQVLLKGKIA